MLAVAGRNRASASGQARMKGRQSSVGGGSEGGERTGEEDGLRGHALLCSRGCNGRERKGPRERRDVNARASCAAASASLPSPSSAITTHTTRTPCRPRRPSQTLPSLLCTTSQVVSPPLLSPAPLSPPHHAATLRAATPLLTGLVTIQEEKVVVQEEHKSDKNGEVVTDVSISETTIVALSPEPLNVSLVLRLHAYRSSS